MPEPKLTMTVAQMAERLGICLMNAYDLTRSVGFPSIKVGRRILIPVAGLERWLVEQGGKNEQAV